MNLNFSANPKIGGEPVYVDDEDPPAPEPEPELTAEQIAQLEEDSRMENELYGL